MPIEHPLIFTGESIPGIMGGWKTQTRRINPHKFRTWQVGDLIWARETICCNCWDRGDAFRYGEWLIKYQADGHLISCPDTLEEWWRRNWSVRSSSNIPSIHMPKPAARNWLRITGLREGNVQDISREDAIAEGVQPNCMAAEWSKVRGWFVPGKKLCTPCRACCRCIHLNEWLNYSAGNNEDVYPVGTPQESFHTLWDPLNAKRGHGWDKNPVIEVITFERIERE